MDVTVYSTPTCPWCVKVKDLLKANNIKFSEVNVAEDTDKAKEMIKKSGQMGVPVTVIANGTGENVVIGYDETKLKKLLKLN